MTSTFHTLETANRSLFTQQAALQTTAHNIANANTPGFSRQIVNINATRPMEAVGLTHTTAAGQLGTGVESGSIKRIRESFLDDEFWDASQYQGNYQIQQDTLSKLETVFAEPSDTGLRTVIDNFWQSWSDLSKDPESIDGRKAVKENALAIVDAFHTSNQQLKDLTEDLTTNIDANTTQANTYLTTIADLNKEIYRTEGLGDDANDLRDQRDNMVDELSKLMNVTVLRTQQGYDINLGQISLVAGAEAKTLSSNDLVAAYNGDLTGGQLYGMIKSRDDYVADYKKELDSLANTMANGKIAITLPAGTVVPEGSVMTVNGVDTTFSGTARTLTVDTQVTVNGINGLHKLGYLLTDPVTAGGQFFTGNTAGDINLDASIDKDPTLIASSMRTTGVDPDSTVIQGNNTMALIMSELKDTKFAFKSDTPDTSDIMATVDDYFRATVSGLGIQSKEAQRQYTNVGMLVEQVDSRRQSVSGVSLDEEMSNMIKFQHAYNAAARVMTTFDQMLDKIINGMGMVGR